MGVNLEIPELDCAICHSDRAKLGKGYAPFEIGKAVTIAAGFALCRDHLCYFGEEIEQAITQVFGPEPEAGVRRG